jgi:hypothetical protein
MEINCPLIEPSILWDIIYTTSVNKDDTTAAMIGAGVYLVLIIIVVFYYNCDLLLFHFLLSVW